MVHWVHCFPRKPQAWSSLKACRYCRVSHILCWYQHPFATASPTKHTFLTPSPKSNFATSNCYARAAKTLESGRIGASLGMHHLSAKRVQNGAKMANGAHTAPPPRIFSLSLTVCNKCTCCAWLGLKMGRARGQKS